MEKVFRVCIAWYKHERGWENSRQLCKPETKSRVCITVENSPNPSSVYVRLCKHRKKVFREILFIDFLIQKHFLNSRSGQSFFVLTNQNAHLITHEQRNFALQKSALNPSKSLPEMPKVRWEQKLYSKYLWFGKERTSRWIFFFKSTFCLRNGLFNPHPPPP